VNVFVSIDSIAGLVYYWVTIQSLMNLRMAIGGRRVHACKQGAEFLVVGEEFFGFGAIPS
jgi:hypothetical protein